MNKKENNLPPKKLYNIARSVALVALILAIILSILMIANYIQTKSIDPLNSLAISQLMLRLQETPKNNALKEQIRALDLLARKAYFTNQWQIRFGSFLLFAFVLTFLIAAKYMSSLKPQLPDLNEEAQANRSWENTILARKYIIFSGLGLFALAFAANVLSESDIEKIGLYDADKAAEAATAAANFPDIEEIRQNWPSFRGPEGNGLAYNAEPPTGWDVKSDSNIIWKIELPRTGFNSPIIWGNKMFMSAADDDTLEVFCIDTETGAFNWRRTMNDIPGSPEKWPDVSRDTGYAAATMATDGQNVFVLFATGDVACLDFNGNRLWAKNIGVPDNHYGHSSSLIIYQNLLLIQFDQNTGGRLIALKTASGDPVYDIFRDVQISWASPILATRENGTELVLNSNPAVISYNPQTGEELWDVECMMGEVAPSPAYADGFIYVVNEYARLVGIQLGDSAKVIWEVIDDLSEVASPVATKDFVIVAASYGTVSCFNSKTGERYWFHDFDQGFYSSPILVGDNVYLMDMMGVMYVFEAAKEFKLVSQSELGENAVAIPAFMNNRIYIRGVNNLYCIGK